MSKTQTARRRKVDEGDVKEALNQEPVAVGGVGPDGKAKEPKDENLSVGLWLLKHTQGIVTASTAIGVLYLRNTHALYYVAGALTTGWCAKMLKKVIRQPRPEGSSITKTHGMPSTHSSTMTFMSLYLALAVPSSLRLLVPLIAATPPTVMWSRVKLGLHTPAQCAVGASLGTLTALALTLAWRGAGAAFGAAAPEWVQLGVGGSLAPVGDEVLHGLEEWVRGRAGLL